MLGSNASVKNKRLWWAVVVPHLALGLLPIPEALSLNPVIDEFV